LKWRSLGLLPGEGSQLHGQLFPCFANESSHLGSHNLRNGAEGPSQHEMPLDNGDGEADRAGT